jgi:hypothetical protein
MNVWYMRASYMGAAFHIASEVLLGRLYLLFRGGCGWIAFGGDSYCGGGGGYVVVRPSMVTRWEDGVRVQPVLTGEVRIGY